MRGASDVTATPTHRAAPARDDRMVEWSTRPGRVHYVATSCESSSTYSVLPLFYHFFSSGATLKVRSIHKIAGVPQVQRFKGAT